MTSELEYGLLRQIELLQDMHGDIDGIKTAPTSLFDYPTGTIPSSNMPMVLSIPDEGEWDMFNFSSQDQQRRTFVVKLIVADHSMGLSGESLLTTVKLMQRVGEEYTRRSKQQLQVTPSQMLLANQEVPVRDSGVTALVAWQDEVYWGCEFIVPIYEKYTVGESG